MITILLFATLIKFTWIASSGPVQPTSYKLCIGATPGSCTTTATVPASVLEKEIDLNVAVVQYATVKAVNEFGESEGSNQVVVGKPSAPAGLTGRLSGN